MAKTARQVISSALRKLGVLAAGETPSADELNDGLSALQSMIDSWSTSDLLAFTETAETFTLTPDQQEYMIGSGGDFDTDRPMEILGITVVDPNGLEIHVNPMKVEQWIGLGTKSSKSTFPTEFYFRNEWPLGRIFFYPVPTENYSVKIYSRKPFVNVTTVNTSIDLPNGYERALEFNLPFELVNEFGGEISPATAKIAEESLSAIKAQNLSKSIPYAATDSALCGSGQGSGWTLSDFLKGGS